MSRTRTLVAVAALAALATLAGATEASAKTRITMSGSTSIAPLATDLARGFLNSHKGAASFRILQGGSDIGIADVAHGRSTIGNSSRDPKPGDPKGIVFNKIARDALCVITNKGNPIANLSQSQIQAIFSGQVRSWRNVPGSKVSGSISLVVRTAASGTQDAFQNIFMGPNRRVSSSARTERSNGLQVLRIKNNPNAIGYASYDFVKGVHTVPYKGVTCNLRNAKSGQYGGTRNFWMVTRGKARGAVATFIKWIRSSSAARSVIATHWIPLR